MKFGKKVAAAVLTVAMVGSLAACDSIGGDMKKDSQTYIQGLLDQYYKGQYNQDYLDMIDMTESEAEEQYLDWLSQEVDYFCYYFSIDYPSDEYKERVGDTYKEIYSQAKYVVHEASKLESGNYAVEVTVEPIDIMLQVTDDDLDVMQDADEYVALLETDMSAMSDAEKEALYKEYDALYADGVLELVRSHLGEVGYQDAKSMVFQMAKGDDGYYSLVEGDLQNFDTYVIAY